MISYYIVGKSGDIVYQPAPPSPSAKTSSMANDGRIRFLPLLLIKDMIRANLQDRLQYVRVGRRTVVFLEKPGLLFIACTHRPYPVPLLLEHLRILDHFLRFSHGTAAAIPTQSHTNCLAHLPFLHERQISSSAALCHVEQLELHNDLRARLTVALRDCCHSSFSEISTLAIPKRTSFFASHPRRATELADITRRQPWSHAFLFAGDKMVARCINSGQDHLHPGDLYFLRLLLNQHLYEYSKSSCGSDSSESTYSGRSRSNSGRGRSSEQHTPSTSSPTLYPMSLHSDPHSPRSSFVYRASSATPFKIREKSASSVSVVFSPTVPSAQWSSPPSHVYNHLLTQYVEADDVSLSSKPSSPMPLTPSQTPGNHLPRNAKAHYDISGTNPLPITDYLSSSLPSDAKPPIFFRNLSARSSPTSRSRRQSVADQLSPKDSIKHLFTNFLAEDDESQSRTTSDSVNIQGKMIDRWLLTRDGRISCCTILLTRIDHGLYAAVICPQRSSTSPTSYSLATQFNSFRTSLNERLRDYSTFLLTKKSTHFTVLSFAVTYPGLIHFVHLDNGIMTAPRLTDLNEQDKSHHLLREVYRIYDTDAIDEWPSLDSLKILSDDMVNKGLACLDTPRHQSVQCTPPGKGKYTFVFQRGKGNAVLLAMYYHFVPHSNLTAMHERLLHDVSQRQPVNCL